MAWRAKLKDAAPSVARDIVAFVGAASISYGAGMIYRPAGFIIAGAFLLAGAAIHAWMSA